MNEAHLIFCNSDEWAAAVKTWIIPGATNGVTLGDHVLEVGPGPGRTTDILKDMTAKLTAVEVDPMLAGKLAARMVGSNVTVVEADATALPFPDDHFSAAVSFTMLHHVPSPELQDRLFAEVAREPFARLYKSSLRRHPRREMNRAWGPRTGVAGESQTDPETCASVSP